MVIDGDTETAFIDAFEAGDELTEFSFSAERGVGINVGEGRRFTRFPRADLTGPTEWANHFPKREGGANATSCIACHNAPFANGAGDIALNVAVDPAHTGNTSLYLDRNTLPLFALAIPQRLAEEISTEITAQRTAGEALACDAGEATVALTSKGIDYGTLQLTRTGDSPCVIEADASGLSGIDEDLIIKPFGWKGNEPTIRSFTRGAAHNELGMQAVELVGDQDGDFDGVINELTVGDLTALAIYMAALERPVTKLELADLGLEELTPEERGDIEIGQALFAEVGCGSCHSPTMEFDTPVFSEPSATPGYYDATFPDGSAPGDHGLAMATAIAFDMTADQPNNQIEQADGTIHHLGALEVSDQGRPMARWYTDFKRHDMGEALSDPDDPLGVGASMFLTRSLAGVGVTGPWLHDGRATSLDEAIMAHGGASADVTASYAALPEMERAKIVAFLENQVMYGSEEEEEH